MRKQLAIVAVIGLSLGLISWGFKGHRAVATIAEKHLTSNTANVVKAYLKGETITNVSTWADENRDKATSSWHYLNLPLGLNHDQFLDAVSKQGNDNVYSAILKVEAMLKDNTSTPVQKNEALKYLIHLVGDAHQPMHVSRKEDKGGNTIQLQFDGKGTNLHALWDSRLIEHEGLSEADIVKQYDWANDAQIKKWQADSPMEWLWESYQISTELYADVKSGQTIDEAYYKKYIKTIHLRIDQAGVRLAGELNKLFNEVTAPKIDVTAMFVNKATKDIVSVTPLNAIGKAVGNVVSTTGKVFSVKDIGSMVLVNLGAAYPNQLLTVVLKGDAKQMASQIEGKTISVEGTVIDYKGKPEIVITEANKISIKE
ncbi:S1/P1 nuclease [Mucilaginibacter ginsenosidivorax]|uniref:S1/P1 nuclease n=1 Tax=Mucilaginibacter ginsenosidivorax TaxID=862126 RepID=A0A5B8VU02_9SPHI|nr:S1/P1 nuclease [Mucilaginibacter ginsenosidivorax]QEC74631.1 S1/P1 nuclease [Mucilaginibacter ginsenosidivorax]